MNLSFAGCGFLGIYHIGVASCFREYAPQVLVNRISGASIGSLAAAALICGIPLGQTTTDVLRVAVKARSRALGPLHPSFDLNSIVKEGLEKALPENAHILCSGRLFISCTKLPHIENVLVSQFHSRDELIQALLCSCFIPFYSGLLMPKLQGDTLVDGGFSNNLPVLDDKTITVSPFAGEHDICPQDESCNILQINIVNTSLAVSPGNVYRLAKILFPPHPEVLNKMCKQGFDDALKYLQRNTMINCKRCLSVQSSVTLSDVCNVPVKSDKSEHAYDDCLDCRRRRQVALLDTLPESIVKAIQEACDEVNKGAINWLFRHRPMKLLSILGIPYVLPIDISILIFCKIWQKLPLLQKEIRSKFDGIIFLIKNFLHKIDRSRHLYSAKFSCQLAITEFDYTEENVSSSYSIPTSEKPPHATCTIFNEDATPKASPALHLPDAPSLTKFQRKSYAGVINPNKEKIDMHRRLSMCEVRQPERVLRNMTFGFTVDLQPNIPSSSGRKKRSVVEAFHSLGEEESDISVIDITNKALNWEQNCIGDYHGNLEPENAEALQKILSVTGNEAVMSYYYVDDDQTVKVTELYNVDEANTSAVLSEEEREINNKLQWENEWMTDPNVTCSDLDISDNSPLFDDKEMSMSDNDSETSDTFQEMKAEKLNFDNKILNTVPKRKKSFIIVN